MAESTPPFGKMNRWWHAAGLPDVLATYLTAVRPKAVDDLLSLEYRESVAGYQNRLPGISVQPIDFPGMDARANRRAGKRSRSSCGPGKRSLGLRDRLPRIDERLLHDSRLPRSRRVDDFDFRAEVREGDWHHGVADVLLEPRGMDRRRHRSDFLAAGPDRPLCHVEIDPRALDLDAYELAPCRCVSDLL